MGAFRTPANMLIAIVRGNCRCNYQVGEPEVRRGAAKAETSARQVHAKHAASEGSCAGVRCALCALASG
eukprot:5267515-Prymnesium_polylepis.1